MFKTSPGRMVAPALFCAALGFTTSSAWAVTTCDLTLGAECVVNGATFSTTSSDLGDVTGTGVLEPFLRLQSSPQEEGYNTDRPQSGTGSVQFDEKTGTWTHSLLFADIPLVDGNYQFILDLGEPASVMQSEISLDALKLFSTADSDINGAEYVAGGFGSDATLLWDMDALGDSVVLLDYNLVGSGNGRPDMVFLVPESFFSGVAVGDYIVLYSMFGATEFSNGTFEEWATLGETSTIPLPAALPMFVAAFGGLFLVGRRRRGITGAA